MTNDPRQKHLAPKQTCPHCHNQFTLGVNGTIEGCDECTGTVRAANGYVIQEHLCTGIDPLRCDDPHCPVHGGS